MAVTQQLSPVYPLGSRLNERGVLELGGCDALELAREFGTPAYVVSEDDLRARARAVVSAYQARTESFDVLYASKAFPCTAVYRVLAEEGIGCDVASGGELALALAGGFDPDRIYLHGNAKSEAELRAALDAGVGHIVIDNDDEIDRLERLATRPQRVLVRVTPDVRGETHASISTGQADSKFGFSMADAPAAIARLRASERLELVGLHFHIGSQLLDVVPYVRAIAALAELADVADLPMVNVGGGLGAVYTDERPPSIEEYVNAKVDAVERYLGPGHRIVDEPGRALVAQSTVTLYTVESVKRNVSTWVAVDGGMSDNLRPMLYGARYEAEVVDRFGGATRCHLAGKHCESGDVILRDVLLDDPRAGDVVVTPATGAYGHALANNYNGVPRPPVVFVKDGDARLVVRRESYEDLLVRDV
jgi:diaminopimelate decarboxylase